MRLMTCSECESMRLIVLVLLHRCASTSNRDPSQESGSITVDRIQRSSQDAGSKERPKSKECSGPPTAGTHGCG
ncbi:MAG: hypothetical protein J3Q66DRAFT_323023 [Benniella sp.]|nr:MAG: hypothetical protein J3Q66DRAFT_323023 [Benniella sp.]